MDEALRAKPQRVEASVDEALVYEALVGEALFSNGLKYYIGSPVHAGTDEL